MEDIEQLRQVLQRLETAVAGPQVKAWLLQITDPSYGLVSTLLDAFLANLSSHDLASALLTILRQLNTHVTDQVLPQLKASATFPPAIVRYLTEVPPKQVSVEAFVLIAAVFDSSNSQALDNPQVVKAIFDSLEYLQGKETVKALVNILAGVSQRSPTAQSNLVLQQCKEHANARFFKEILLYQVNRSDPVDMLNCMTCCADLIREESGDDHFLYSNDLTVLADMMFNNLENMQDCETVRKTLEVFSALYRCTELQTTKYRLDDLAALLKIISESESYSPPTKQAAAMLTSDLRLGP